MSEHNDNSYAKTIFLKCKLSKINTKTTDSPFFIPESDESIVPEKMLNIPRTQTFDITPKINSSIDPVLKTIYEFIDSPNREFNYGIFTFFSLSEVKKRNTYFIENKQYDICDLAVSYYGMGHVVVLSWDTNNSCYFMRVDGGPNGYEREDNFNFIAKFDTNKLESKYKIHPSKLFETINIDTVEELCKYFLESRS